MPYYDHRDLITDKDAFLRESYWVLSLMLIDQLDKYPTLRLSLGELKEVALKTRLYAQNAFTKETE